MRLILPTGEGGADRAYELDGVLDLSRVTLNETIELKRVTGMDLARVYTGLGMLDRLIGIPNDKVLVAMSRSLDLMEAYRALVWMARHRAGDRAPDGSVLTVEQAADFPFEGLGVEPDPGDARPGEDDAADPTLPPADGGPATVGGTPQQPPAPGIAGPSSQTSD